MSILRFQCRHEYASGFRLDVEFEAGEGVTALSGPSGSGKSTIFAMIAGILRPRTGVIQLGDRVLLDTGSGVDVVPEQRRVALVFQDHLLFPHLTVEGNLSFGRARRPLRHLDFARVVEVLELAPLLRRMPRTLSGGERQRVALGRALLQGPELLLMDEPLAALDAKLKAQILDYLRECFAEWRIPTMFVSHDAADARSVANRTVTLNEGRVVEASDLVERERIESTPLS